MIQKKDKDLIFFTGVPGSKWSGIAQEIKNAPGYNVSDRAPHRVYTHGEFSGHKDSYFGTGMEFDTNLDYRNLISPYQNTDGKLLLMSHEWPYHFEEIIKRYPGSSIILVYRPNDVSLEWWLQAGGFNITYPNYEYYIDVDTMKEKIKEQNDLILDFAHKNMLLWKQHKNHKDIFICTYNGCD